MKDRRFDFDALRRYVGVLMQQGRVQVDADADEYDYVRMRRLPLAILQSLDRKLGWAVFEPVSGARARTRALPGWTDANVHDPGITLVELLAYAADRLAYYADEVAAEARLRTRRRRAAALAAGVLLVAWHCGRRR